MKQIFLFLILFFGNTLTLICQTGEEKFMIIKSKNEINKVADLYNSNYQLYYLKIDFDNFLSYNINDSNKSIELSIKDIKIIQYIKQIFECGDSIARTDNYYNKKFAHLLFIALIKQLNSSDAFKQSENEKQLIIQKIVFSDLKYCCRFTDASSLLLLKKEEITPKISELTKELLIHPKRTVAEAQLIINSTKPFFNIADTIGFKSKVQKYKNGDKNLEFEIKKVEWLIRDAKNARMELGSYIDSMQSVNNKIFIADYIKQLIDVRTIIVFSYNHELKKFATYIEKIYNENSKSGYELDASITKLIELVLAHFQYENFEQKIISQINDSLKTTKPGEIKKYESYFQDLIFINTQQSIFSIAPMLLLKEKVKIENLDIIYSIGAFIFCKLDKNIKNLPWEYHNIKTRKILINNEETVELIDEWFIDNNMPSDFLEKMYQWMVENKGNYLLKRD